MKLLCTASSDTYITNKIVNQKLRADDANVGHAGTLDLFKLYNETKLLGSSSQDEVSRLLVKFDLTKASSLMSSKLDIRNFNAKIKLFDINSGHAVPSNFTVIVHPLSRSFDEGVGRDVGSFNDLGVSNFLTASITNGVANVWYVSGANKIGGLNTGNIDAISSGTVGGVQFNYFNTQTFVEGDEDLSIDVTNAISGVLANVLPDHGFRIAFSGTNETDLKSRFVKRFGSRHTVNPHLRPRLEISFDDSIQDHRDSFYFDTTGTLFIQNSLRSAKKNLIANGSEITGQNSLKLKLVKGQFTKTVNVSQHTMGSSDANVTGLYSGTFAISSDDASIYTSGKSLSSLISKEKEIEFNEYWYTNDGSKGFHTGTLTIKMLTPSSILTNDDLEVYATNSRSLYSINSQEQIRLFAINHTKDAVVSRKKPIRKQSEVFEKVYYRVLDADSGQIMIDFGESDNSTRVSTDSSGMFFDFHFDILTAGRSYLFEYLIIDGDLRRIIRDKRTRFTIQ